MTKQEIFKKLGLLIQVKNFCDVKNQFILEYENGRVFQSHKSIIAVKVSGHIYLDSDKWNYSVTTSKYRSRFMFENSKETNKKVKAGIYTMIDLNA